MFFGCFFTYLSAIKNIEKHLNIKKSYSKGLFEVIFTGFGVSLKS